MQLAFNFNPENWVPIPSYEGFYEISDEGVIYNLKTNKILSPSIHHYSKSDTTQYIAQLFQWLEDALNDPHVVDNSIVINTDIKE